MIGCVVPLRLSSSAGAPCHGMSSVALLRIGNRPSKMSTAGKPFSRAIRFEVQVLRLMTTQDWQKASPIEVFIARTAVDLPPTAVDASANRVALGIKHGRQEARLRVSSKQ